MRLGSSAVAPRHHYVRPSVTSAGVFVSALLPRRAQRKARLSVCKPVAAQRTAVAADDAPEPEGFPSESLGNFQSSQPRRAVPKPAPTHLRNLILGVLQLSAVVGLLILWPARFYSDHIPNRVWHAAALYCIFFGFGGLRRTLKYGKLSSRKNDAQVSTWAGKRAIIIFVVFIVLGHQNAITRYCKHKGSLVELFKLPGLRYLPALLLPAAVALHVWATETLGKAYDRLVTPDSLVRSGPYAWCQHPIYTSYMMLFCGTALWFGSEECCLYMLYFCWSYFKGRVQTEGKLLQEAFGNEYIAYKEHTGSFLPRFF